MFCFWVSAAIGVILMLIRVAFITLLERKILALSQFRLGPNKVLLKGLLQPLLDGVKLFHKSLLVPFQALGRIIILGPALVLVGIILVWRNLSSFPLHGRLWVRRFFFLLILRFGIYGVLLRGLRGTSKYSFLGGIRACIQRVRYEIRLALIILSVVIFTGHSSLDRWRSLIFLLIFPVWGLRVVAETNRAPLDLAEGESELIRGLNLELGRVFFALIFVGEYGIVICFAWFTRLLFWRGGIWARILWIFLRLFFRRVFPRFRYDKLLSFCWTKLLPLTVMWMLLGTVTRRI